MKIHAVYTKILRDLIFVEGLIFADHQVEYIVSLSHCFFLRIKILCSESKAYNEICKF